MKVKHRAFLLDILKSVLLTVVLSTIGWYFLHGVPLIGLPKAEEVKNVTLLRADGESRVVVDTEDIELLVKAANLLSYRLGTPENEQPLLTVVYELKNGDACVLRAGETTVDWKGKLHPLKQEEVFYNIVEGLFFFNGNQAETRG